eukprot:2080552-Rhodomonas_salina.5
MANAHQDSGHATSSQKYLLSPSSTSPSTNNSNDSWEPGAATHRVSSGNHRCAHRTGAGD